MQNDIVKRPTAEPVKRDDSKNGPNPTPALETVATVPSETAQPHSDDPQQTDTTTKADQSKSPAKIQSPKQKTNSPTTAITMAIIVCVLLIGIVVYSQVS